MTDSIVTGNTTSSNGKQVSVAVLTNGSTLTTTAVDWLWNGWLAAGKLHILGGQPGTGKTTIALSMAATITSGGKWPDGSQAAPGSVVIWSGEDDLADTLLPRLLAAGADRSKIHFVAATRNDKGQQVAFDPALHADALLEALKAIPDVRLLVLDPIVSAVAGDSHKGAEVRRGLQPLVDLAAARGAALVGITHLSKGTGGREPIERITGSIAFGALARIVLVTGRRQQETPDSPSRFMVRAKSNLGPDEGGFSYDLQQVSLNDYPGVEASVIRWGGAIEGSARALMNEAEADEQVADEKVEFLRELLANGSMPAKDVYAAAEAEGWSADAMKRAKKKLAVEATKNGIGRCWVWTLPSQKRAEGSMPVAVLPSHPSVDEDEYIDFDDDPRPAPIVN